MLNVHKVRQPQCFDLFRCTAAGLVCAGGGVALGAGERGTDESDCYERESLHGEVTVQGEKPKSLL